MNHECSAEVARAELERIGWAQEHENSEHESRLETIAESRRPAILLRPVLTQDGDMWCTLLGVNLMEGVSGFGSTPELAMLAFDRAFSEPSGTYIWDRVINDGVRKP